MKTCPLIDDNKVKIIVKESWAQSILGRDIEYFFQNSFSNTFDNWGLTFLHGYYMVITLSKNLYNHIMMVIYLEIKTIFLAMVSFL